mmetsp:Transcript_12815/g.35845  ORF Transcript_12815/g.35845 Transcript_12815/m.35845 type:complete len:474 (-) Transcript_12815:792-2213(-)
MCLCSDRAGSPSRIPRSQRHRIRRRNIYRTDDARLAARRATQRMQVPVDAAAGHARDAEARHLQALPVLLPPLVDLAQKLAAHLAGGHPRALGMLRGGPIQILPQLLALAPPRGLRAPPPLHLVLDLALPLALRAAGLLPKNGLQPVAHLGPHRLLGLRQGPSHWLAVRGEEVRVQLPDAALEGRLHQLVLSLILVGLEDDVSWGDSHKRIGLLLVQLRKVLRELVRRQKLSILQKVLRSRLLNLQPGLLRRATTPLAHADALRPRQDRRALCGDRLLLAQHERRKIGLRTRQRRVLPGSVVAVVQRLAPALWPRAHKQRRRGIERSVPGRAADCSLAGEHHEASALRLRPPRLEGPTDGHRLLPLARARGRPSASSGSVRQQGEGRGLGRRAGHWPPGRREVPALGGGGGDVRQRLAPPLGRLRGTLLARGSAVGPPGDHGRLLGRAHNATAWFRHARGKRQVPGGLRTRDL